MAVCGNDPVVALPTISDVIELQTSCDNDGRCAQQLVDKYSCFKNCSLDSLRKKIGLTINKSKLLKRNKTKNGPAYSSYLSEVFTPPPPGNKLLQNTVRELNNEGQLIAKKLIENTKSVVEENKALKRKLSDIEHSNNEYKEKTIMLENSFTTMSKVAVNFKELVEKHRLDKDEMKTELDKCQLRYEQASNQIAELTADLNKAKEKVSKYTPRNVNKKIKRKSDKIEELTESCKQLKSEKENLEKENDSLWNYLLENEDVINSKEKEQTETVDQLKYEKVNLQKRISRLNLKVETLRKDKEEFSLEKDRLQNEFDNEIKKHKDEISQLEQIIDISETNDIKTFENGKYTNEIRHCCMQLISECNVSLNKLPLVINTVTKSLTGRVPEKILSKTLLSWLTAEAKCVASRHVAEKMLEDLDIQSGKGHTLHQDATTKFHKHYEGFQVTLKSGDSVTMGLKEVGSGTADSYFDAFSDTINDLVMTLPNTHNEETRAKLICSIKNYMSDQCATNSKLNESLDKIRNDLMPAVLMEFDQLTPKEQRDILDTGKFSCRLHLLANFGTCADKGLAMFEKSVCEGENPHSFKSDESGAFRLARTSAKAFTRRGSDKVGVAQYWETFLKGRNRSNLLVPFKGHRINISFHDCGAVYFHQQDIRDFIADFSEQNQLLQSVNFDISEKVFLAGCRAMGIIDKLITTPFWNILEQEGSILDLNYDLLQLKLCLERLANNGEAALQGEEMFSPGKVAIKKDQMYASLFTDTGDATFDSLTQMAIELISSEMLIILERQAESQLPGGKYAEPTEEQKISSVNVPKTNVISERDMAVLDNLIKFKPSASVLTLETQTMCQKNRPFHWLSSLDEEQKQDILTGARKLAPEMKKQFKLRQEKIQNDIKQKLDEKKKKTEMKEMKLMTQKTKYTNDIVKFGGVWEILNVEHNLEPLDQATQRAALLSQIKFQKFVLNAKGPRTLFQESCQNKKYSTDTLKQNLITILELNSNNSQTETTGLVYSSLEEVKENVSDKKKALWVKVMEGRNKRLVKKVKTNYNRF